MSNSVLILSDMFGVNDKSEYLKKTLYFFDKLGFSCDMLSTPEYCGINNYYKEKDIHIEFIERGIDIGVYKLSKNSSKYDIAIGFSIGGTILWKSIKQGFNVPKILCFSPSRLRFESGKIMTESHMALSDEGHSKYHFDKSLHDYLYIEKSSNHDFYKDISLEKFLKNLL
ncbi:hypothetical protein FLM55_09190 [Francisella sp. Scap27]|uniref:hypothetical protein n=1 Tax=Francisella sp. Scap27 TaxID=2589986 RepID=UPI0015B8D674|nr:hypothetical protein [Francisella sp. Scap27]QLE79895.1 hypothetical protein FLM55_09190 [Francisella sp. Scap27]